MLQLPSINLKKYFYPFIFIISPDLVSRTLSCPLKENTFILHQEDSDADNDDCHPGKYLFSNGKIQQRFCFTTSCTRCQKDIKFFHANIYFCSRLGSPCPESAQFPDKGWLKKETVYGIIGLNTVFSLTLIRGGLLDVAWVGVDCAQTS